MKSKMVLCFVFACFIFLNSNAQTTEKASKISVKCNSVNDLTENGIRILNGIYNKQGYFEGEIISDDTNQLHLKNFKFSVLIKDISAYYTQRNENNTVQSPKNIIYNCQQPKEYVTPTNFHLGSMGGFLTYTEAIAQLDTMHLLYPNLISQKVQIGTSLEGRAIYSIKISDNPTVNETEKQVLYTAVHHSQEPAGLQQLIFYMYYLLENYHTDSEIKYLIDNLELYFVPVVNPDGYVYNQTQNPNGGGTWRKNRRPNGLFNGVDLNRNYAYAFGYNEIGSSSIGAHPWYRGTSAFSEPESQSLKTFIESHNFLLDLNWHSYGNYLIYPWNYETLLTSDSILFEEYSRYISLESHYRYGTCDQTYGYNSNGDADDWGYGETVSKNKVISLTAEIGSSDDGFWPQTSNIIPLCKKSLDMNIRLARLAAKYALVSDVTPTFLTSLQGNIQVEAYCLGLDVPANFSISLDALSPQILATGTDLQYNGMNTLERRNGAISYTLMPNTPQGTNLKFALSISNGIYTWTDTITKIYCTPDTLLQDNANDLLKWNSSGFSTTTEQFGSSPSSFTESPNGNYGLLQSSTLELISTLDLTTANNAYLLFKATWQIEKSYDWAEVFASSDNGTTWIPLCGRYSSYGTDDQNLSHPVYDGFLNSWVKEEISLHDFLGSIIKIKFEFHSDQTHNFNGMYLDDIYVLSFKNPVVGIKETKNYPDLLAYPNPSNGEINIHISDEFGQKLWVEIEDLCGKCVFKKEFQNIGNTISLKYMNIESGSYLLKLSSENKVQRVQKIVFSN